MNTRDLVKVAKGLRLAKKDRRGGFTESIDLSHGRSVGIGSKTERIWWDEFNQMLSESDLRRSSWSLRTLFEEIVDDGHELVRSWSPEFAGGGPLQEAAGAITSSDFSNITGQIVYSTMMQAMADEELVFSSLIPTQVTPFDGEKIPGIAGLGDLAEVVGENEEFPLVGTGEDWIETPQTTKRGLIVPVTKEAIFFDRTGDLLTKASAVGASLALNKEKRAIDCLIDENSTAHRFKWRGTTYATYQTTTPWDNVTASNALVDHTDIDAAQQTLNNILDPNTGEPVVVSGDTLVCTKSNELVANRIRNMTSNTAVSPGYATSGNPNEEAGPNPLGGNAFNVVTSRQLGSRMASSSNWFLGDPARAFAYMENWPITVQRDTSAEFMRDVVSMFKASERGQYATLQPRFMTKCTA